jgi:hypothetical protein
MRDGNIAFPAEAGIHFSAVPCAAKWTPAFAGHAIKGSALVAVFRRL